MNKVQKLSLRFIMEMQNHLHNLTLGIRTSPHVLIDEDCLISKHKKQWAIRHLVYGGPYHSKSLPDELKNIKHIKNRKQQLKSSSKQNKSNKLMMSLQHFLMLSKM